MLFSIIIFPLIKSASQERNLGDCLRGNCPALILQGFFLPYDLSVQIRSWILKWTGLKKIISCEYTIAQSQYHMVCFFRNLIESCPSS
jgi:hypothetical protein